ncbi:hypothetical protein [Armatimonas sp.]|uniref:hypothetical protein n=1 Tax=Armatimonas sp. TaxID=1872638 RepID=UPI003753D725
MQKVQLFGPKKADTPTLRRTKAYGGYEVVFPTTKLPPVRLGAPEGFLLQDRLALTPGITLQLLEHEKNIERTPPSISLNGQKQPLELERFLTDPALWPADVLNNTKYQLGQGYYHKSTFRVFGLAQSLGKSYLGASWYSPAATDRHDVLGLIFQLEGDGKTLQLLPLYTIPEVGNDPNTDMPRPLLLDTLPSGELLLSAGGKLTRRAASGTWSVLPSRLLGRYPQLLTYGALWKRGRWLVTGRQWEMGKTIQFQVLVSDAATRQKVCVFSWRG